MSGESGEASAVVTRNYRESGSTCDSCAQAVLLLFNFRETKQKGRSVSGPDKGEESKKTTPTLQVDTDSCASNGEVLSALRELFSQHPAMKHSGTETLSRALFMFRFLPSRSGVFEVEAALEALCVEGELLS